MENERIIRRIKGLLSLAEDNANIEESQNAFLQAQRMMIKYGVDSSEITDDEEVKKVLEQGGTDYKRLSWWERRLAQIIAPNFRCKNYIQNRHVQGKSQIQRKIMFMGRENDVEIASKMYRLVIEATTFYSNRYIKLTGIQGNRGHTIDMKNTYIRGFLNGLEEKFEEQVSSNEWGLVLVIPQEVHNRYDEVVTGKYTPFTIPDIADTIAYNQGYEEGNAIDYTKSTIHDDIIT